MVYDAREFARIRNPIVLICALIWVLLLVEADNVNMYAHCPAMSVEAVPSSVSFQVLLVMSSPASAARFWALMWSR